MNKTVKEIVEQWADSTTKLKELEKLEEDIAFAKKIVKGEYKQCLECKEYFLTRTFFTETERIDCQICTYDSPYNSGDDEYAEGYADITYLVCPKGCKTIIDKIEYIK